MTKIANNCQYNYFRNYDHGKDSCDKAISDPITLVEGNLYYMEIFSSNYGSAGYFTVSVEVPNPDPLNLVFNSAPEVQQVNISYTPDYEKYSVKVWNTEIPFAIQLKYINPSTRVTQWDRTTISRKWSEWTAQTFRDQLDYAANYYSTVIETYDLDQYGNRV